MTGDMEMEWCEQTRKSAPQRVELNQKKRTIDKTPPDVGKWKYYIGGYFNGEEI